MIVGNKEDSMKFFFKELFAIIFALGLVSCASSGTGRVISPQGLPIQVIWTEEERAKDITLKTLRTTPEASFHLIHLKGTEKPHVHDRHDVAVFILSGEAEFSIQDRVLKVKAGDVLEVPSGMVHWAKNQDTDATVVYAVFTPPYDGKDWRGVE